MTAHLVKLFVAMLLSLLAIAFGVAYTGYEGRRDLVVSQRAGCERSKLDRVANARGWRSVGRVSVALELEARSRVSCVAAFPAATFWP